MIPKEVMKLIESLTNIEPVYSLDELVCTTSPIYIYIYLSLHPYISLVAITNRQKPFETHHLEYTNHSSPQSV